MSLRSRLSNAEHAVGELRAPVQRTWFQVALDMKAGIATPTDFAEYLDEYVEDIRAALAVDAHWVREFRASGWEPDLRYVDTAAAGVAALPPGDDVPPHLTAILQAGNDRCWPPPHGHGTFGELGQNDQRYRSSCFVLAALRTLDGEQLRRDIADGVYDSHIETDGKHIEQRQTAPISELAIERLHRLTPPRPSIAELLRDM